MKGNTNIVVQQCDDVIIYNSVMMDNENTLSL